MFRVQKRIDGKIAMVYAVDRMLVQGTNKFDTYFLIFDGYRFIWDNASKYIPVVK